MKWLFAGAKYLAKVTIHTIRYWWNKITFSLKGTMKAKPARVEAGTPAGTPEQKISIVFHAYHLKLAKQIFVWIEDFAKAATLPVNLIITTPAANVVEVKTLATSDAFTSEVIEVENHGRDIWPFLRVCQSGKLSSSVLVLKIHTKAPRQLGAKVSLGVESVQELLKPELVPGLLSQAKANPYFVATYKKYIGKTVHWGANIGEYFKLLKTLEVEPLPRKLRFPSGTIFWTTGKFAELIGKLAVTRSDFQGEPSPDDGATEHVLERLFGMLAKDNGGVIPLERLVTGEHNANRNSRN